MSPYITNAVSRVACRFAAYSTCTRAFDLSSVGNAPIPLRTRDRVRDEILAVPVRYIPSHHPLPRRRDDGCDEEIGIRHVRPYDLLNLPGEHLTLRRARFA